MSSRRALLIRRGVSKVTLTRTSNTTYLVESTYASANLKFKRLSDGYTQDVANATLPYTFTHTAGEVWEVSGAGGTTYVADYGISFTNGRLYANNASDVMFALPMQFRGVINNAGSGDTFLSKYVGVADRWQLRNVSGNYVLVVRNSSGNIVLNSSRVVSAEYINLMVEDLGSDWQISANTNTATITDSSHLVGGETTIFEVAKFYDGVVHSFSVGSKIWKLKEGIGNLAYATDDTVLNIENGVWVKI